MDIDTTEFAVARDGTIDLSIRSTKRSQRRAISTLCVTVKKVVPLSALTARIHSNTESTDLLSRLPVGSSASTSGGAGAAPTP